MTYYAKLIEAWNLSSASAGALPQGVTGASLFGLSTEAKGTGMGSGVSDLQGEVRQDWCENDSLQFGQMRLTNR